MAQTPARRDQHGSAEIRKYTPQNVRAELFGMLNEPKVRQQISDALAGAFDINQYVRMAMTAYSRGDKTLKQAHPVSIVGAVVQAAQAGLSLDPLLGEAYVVARKNKNTGGHWASLMIGYPGLMKRARRAQGVDFDMAAVFVGDEFEYQQGTNPSIRHVRSEKPPPRGRDGKPEVRCAYAVAHFPSGYKRVYMMPRWEIDETRARSGTPNGPAWRDNYPAMAAKSALRRVMKACPMDDMTARLISQEERAEVGKVTLPDGLIELFDGGEGFEQWENDDSEAEPTIEAEFVEHDNEPQAKAKPSTIDDLKAAAKEAAKASAESPAPPEPEPADDVTKGKQAKAVRDKSKADDERDF